METDISSILNSFLIDLYKGIGQERTLQYNLKNDQISNFIDKLKHRYKTDVIKKQFLWDFLCYNIGILLQRKTVFDSMILPNWVLSQSSIDRWNKKFNNWYITKQNFLYRYRISDREFVDEIEAPIYDRIDIEDLEEIERKRFFGTEDGFLNCMLVSSYNPLSEVCRCCKFKQKCK